MQLHLERRNVARQHVDARAHAREVVVAEATDGREVIIAECGERWRAAYELRLGVAARKSASDMFGGSDEISLAFGLPSPHHAIHRAHDRGLHM